jgi:hypothetical protein
VFAIAKRGRETNFVRRMPYGSLKNCVAGKSEMAVSGFKSLSEFLAQSLI